MSYSDFTLYELKSQFNLVLQERVESGISQCIAEMIAAQLFNQQRNQQISCIYGGVTTGSNWKFMKLVDNTVSIESGEHFIGNIELILGILTQIVYTTFPQM